MYCIGMQEESSGSPSAEFNGDCKWSHETENVEDKNKDASLQWHLTAIQKFMNLLH